MFRGSRIAAPLLVWFVCGCEGTADETAVPGPLLEHLDRVHFIGNSFSGNFGGLNHHLQVVLARRQGLEIETTPEAGDWYYGRALSSMTPELDFVANEGNVDVCVFTSGRPDTMRMFAEQPSQSCGEVVLFSTWNGANPAFNPEVFPAAIEGMVEDARTIEAEFPSVRVVPTAHVWRGLSLDPPLDPPRADYLYVTDNIHQNGLGTIVNAYTMYAALTAQSPVGLEYDPNALVDVPFVVEQRVGLHFEEEPFLNEGDVVTLDASLQRTLQQRVWRHVNEWYADEVSSE